MDAEIIVVLSLVAGAAVFLALLGINSRRNQKKIDAQRSGANSKTGGADTAD